MTGRSILPALCIVALVLASNVEARRQKAGSDSGSVQFEYRFSTSTKHSHGQYIVTLTCNILRNGKHFDTRQKVVKFSSYNVNAVKAKLQEFKESVVKSMETQTQSQSQTSFSGGGGRSYQLTFSYSSHVQDGHGQMTIYYTLYQNGQQIDSGSKTFDFNEGNQEQFDNNFAAYKSMILQQHPNLKASDVNVVMNKQQQVTNRYELKFETTVSVQNNQPKLTIKYVLYKNGAEFMTDTKVISLKTTNKDEVMAAFTKYRVQIENYLKNQQHIDLNNGGNGEMQVPENMGPNVMYEVKFSYKIQRVGGNMILFITYILKGNGKQIDTKQHKFQLDSDSPSAINSILNNYMTEIRGKYPQLVNNNVNVVFESQKVTHSHDEDTYQLSFENTVSWQNNVGKLVITYKLFKNGMLDQQRTKVFTLKTKNKQEVHDIFNVYRTKVEQELKNKQNDVEEFDEGNVPTGEGITYVEKFSYTHTFSRGHGSITITYRLFKNGVLYDTVKQTFPLPSTKQSVINNIVDNFRVIVRKKHPEIFNNPNTPKPQQPKTSTVVYKIKFVSKVVWHQNSGTLIIKYKIFRNRRLVKTIINRIPIKQNKREYILELINKYKYNVVDNHDTIIEEVQNEPKTGDNKPNPNDKFTVTFSYTTSWKNQKGTLTIIYKVFKNGKVIREVPKTFDLETTDKEEVTKILNDYKDVIEPVVNCEVEETSSEEESIEEDSEEWEDLGEEEIVEEEVTNETEESSEQKENSHEVHSHEGGTHETESEESEEHESEESEEHVSEESEEEPQKPVIPSKGYFETFTHETKWVDNKGIVTITYTRYKDGNVIKQDKKTFPVPSKKPEDLTEIITEYEDTVTIKNPYNFVEIPEEGYFEHYYVTTTWKDGKGEVTIVHKVFKNGKVTKTTTQKFPITSKNPNDVKDIIDKYTETVEKDNTNQGVVEIPRGDFVETFTYFTTWTDGKGTVTLVYRKVKDGKVIDTKKKDYPLKSTNPDEVTEIVEQFKKDTSVKGDNVDQEQIPQKGVYTQFWYTTNWDKGIGTITVTYKMFVDGKEIKTDKKTFPIKSNKPDDVTEVFDDFKETIITKVKEDYPDIPEEGYFEHYYVTTTWKDGKGEITIVHKVFKNGKVTKTTTQKFPITSKNPKDVKEIVDKYTETVEKDNTNQGVVEIPRGDFVETFTYFTTWTDGKGTVTLVYRKVKDGKVIDTKKKDYPLKSTNPDEVTEIVEQFKKDTSVKGDNVDQEQIPQKGVYTQFWYTTNWDKGIGTITVTYKMFVDGKEIKTDKKTFPIKSNKPDDVTEVFEDFKETIISKVKEDYPDIPEEGYFEHYYVTTTWKDGKGEITIVHKVFKNGKVTKTTTQKFPITSKNPKDVKDIVDKYTETVEKDNTNQGVVEIPRGDFVETFTYFTTWTDGKGTVTLVYRKVKDGKVIDTKKKDYPLKSTNPDEVTEIVEQFKKDTSVKGDNVDQEQIPQKGVYTQFWYTTNWDKGIGTITVTYKMFVDGKEIKTDKKTFPIKSNKPDDVTEVFEDFKETIISKVKEDYPDIPEEGYFEHYYVTTTWKDGKGEITIVHKVFKNGKVTKTTTQKFPITSKNPKDVKDIVDKYTETVEKDNTNQGVVEIPRGDFVETFTYFTTWTDGKGTVTLVYRKVKDGKVIDTKKKDYPLKSTNPDEVTEIVEQFKKDTSVKGDNVDQEQIPQKGVYTQFWYTTNWDKGIGTITVTYKMFVDGKEIKTDKKTFPIKSNKPDDVTEVFEDFKETIISKVKEDYPDIPEEGYFEHYYVTTTWKDGKGEITIVHKVFKNGKVTKTTTQKFPITSKNPKDVKDIVDKYTETVEKDNTNQGVVEIPRGDFVETFTYFTTWTDGKGTVTLVYRKVKDGKVIDTKKKDYPLKSTNPDEVTEIVEQFKKDTSVKGDNVDQEQIPQKGVYTQFWYTTNWDKGIGTITVTYKMFVDGKEIKTDKKTFPIKSNKPDDVTEVFEDFKETIISKVKEDYPDIPEEGYFEHYYVTTTWKDGKGEITIVHKVFKNGKVTKTTTQKFPITSKNPKDVKDIVDKYTETVEKDNTNQGVVEIPRGDFVETFTYFTTWTDGKGTVTLVYRKVKDGKVIDTKKKDYPLKSTNPDEVTEIVEQFKKDTSVKGDNVDQEQIPQKGVYTQFWYTTNWDKGIGTITVTYKMFVDGKEIKTDKKTFPIKSNKPDDVTEVFEDFKETIISKVKEDYPDIPEEGYFEHYYVTTTWKDGKGEITIVHKVFKNGKVTKTTTQKFPITSKNPKDVKDIVDKYTETVEKDNTNQGVVEIPRGDFVETFTYFTTWTDGKGTVTLVYRKVKDGKVIDTKKKDYPLKSTNPDEVTEIVEQFKKDTSVKGDNVDQEQIPQKGVYTQFWYTTNWDKGIGTITVTYKMFVDGKEIKTDKKTFPIKSNKPDDVTEVFEDFKETIISKVKEDYPDIPEEGYFEHYYVTTTWTGGKGKITIAHKVFRNGKVIKQGTQTMTLRSHNPEVIKNIVNEYKVSVQTKSSAQGMEEIARDTFQERFTYSTSWNNGQGVINFVYNQVKDGKVIPCKTKTKTLPLKTTSRFEISDLFLQFKKDTSVKGSNVGSEQIPSRGFYSKFWYNTIVRNGKETLILFSKLYKNGKVIKTDSKSVTLRGFSGSEIFGLLKNYRGEMNIAWQSEFQLTGSENFVVGGGKQFVNKNGEQSFILSGGKTNKNMNGEQDFIIGGGHKHANMNGQQDFVIGGARAEASMNGRQDFVIGGGRTHGNMNGGQEFVIGGRNPKPHFFLPKLH